MLLNSHCSTIEAHAVLGSRPFQTSTGCLQGKRNIKFVNLGNIAKPATADFDTLPPGPEFQEYPRVMFHDPWLTTKSKEDTQRLAKLVLGTMKQHAPMSSHELFDKFQAEHRRPFYTRGLFKSILVHLKEKRFIWTKRNPETKTGSPRVFVTFDFQAEHRGSPDRVAEKLAENARKFRETTIKRCRSRKPGVPVVRRQAFGSFVHWQAGLKAMSTYNENPARL